MKFRGTHETPQEIGHMRHPSVVEGYWTLVIPNSVSFPGPATRDSVATGATLAVAQSIVVTALLRGYSSMSPVFPPPGVDYRKAIQLLEESTAPSRGQWVSCRRIYLHSDGAFPLGIILRPSSLYNIACDIIIK